jgi:predicted ArsR family transcriptional regulator
MPRGDKRFWSSTRGRVLGLLRRGTRTVSELAAELALTDNAVRSHITTLERDGLVRASGVRRGSRKPTVTYDLSAEAEQLFPRAYGPVLRHVLDALSTSLPAPQVEGVMRAAGHRIASTFFPIESPARNGTPADQVATVLSELGGCCQREEGNGRLAVGCSDCPLLVATEGHPEVCVLVETVLSDVIKAPVQQRCGTNPPRCRFEIATTTQP